MNAHRHSPQRRHRRCRRSHDPRPPASCKRCIESDSQNRWGYVKHIHDRQGDCHNVDAPWSSTRCGEICGCRMGQLTARNGAKGGPGGSGRDHHPLGAGLTVDMTHVVRSGAESRQSLYVALAVDDRRTTSTSPTLQLPRPLPAEQPAEALWWRIVGEEARHRSTTPKAPRMREPETPLSREAER